MKNVVLTALALSVAVVAQAPKSFGSLDELTKAYDADAAAAQKKVSQDRLAAIQAYVADPKHAKAEDLADAHMRAGELAQEMGKWEVVKSHAEKALAAMPAEAKDGEKGGDARLLLGQALVETKAPVAKVSEVLKPIIDGGDMTKGQKSVMNSYEALQALGNALADAGNKKEALTLWGDWKDRMAHPQLQNMAKSEIANLEMLGTAPKAINVTDFAGKPLTLDQYKGKVLLIDFWATWCGPCKAELPNVIETYNKYHATGFEVLGISLDEDKDALTKFLKANKMEWRQFFDGQGWKNEVAVAYGVQSIPATYLLDREGKIVKMNLRGEALKAAVAKLCAPAKP